jgi:hypothetical protein
MKFHIVPTYLEDIEAYTALIINVAVIYLSLELNLWRLKRIILWKLYLQEENATLIRRVRRTHNGRLPFEQIIPCRTSAAIGWWVIPEVGQFLVDSLERHVAWR